MRLAYTLRSIWKYSFRFFNLHQVVDSFNGYVITREGYEKAVVTRGDHSFVVRLTLEPET